MSSYAAPPFWLYENIINGNLVFSKSLSDDFEAGLVGGDLRSVDLWCQAVADRIAGAKVALGDRGPDGLPRVFAKGIDAIVAGALEKM